MAGVMGPPALAVAALVGVPVAAVAVVTSPVWGGRMLWKRYRDDRPVYGPLKPLSAKEQNLRRMRALAPDRPWRTPDDRAPVWEHL